MMEEKVFDNYNAGYLDKINALLYHTEHVYHIGHVFDCQVITRKFYNSFEYPVREAHYCWLQIIRLGNNLQFVVI